MTGQILTQLLDGIISVCSWKLYLCLIGASCFLGVRQRRFINVIFKTFRRDVKGMYLFFLLTIRVRIWIWKNSTLPVLFEQRVRKHPNKICFIFEDKTWTFNDMNEYSNRIANIFYDAGYRRGDVIALLMENRPEYVAIWLGLSKIGVCTAFINTNQRLKVLLHSLTAAKSKALICGAELIEAAQEIQETSAPDLRYFVSGTIDHASPTFTVLDKLLDKAPNTSPPPSGSKITDDLMYIFTSGTTGLPKAAIIPQTRYIAAASLNFLIGLSDHDILYNTLPLYHSLGGILGTGQALIFGLTTVLKKKFSASRFWDDCVQHGCTFTFYIGEICRYLLAQKPRPIDRQHNIRVIFGAGLRPQLWETFIERFGIKEVREVYASTEGNANMINIDNHPHAIGFISQIIPASIYPVRLIRVNEKTGEPIRGKNGLCVLCSPGEVGEVVGKIKKGDPLREFPGYVNEEATKSKIIKDVFKKGDYAFSSGDFLVMDELGYVYFRDRTGDTFRWKGENVSTEEVQAVISSILSLKDSVAYGVLIPGCEGRAGMAAIVDDDNTVDLDELSAGLKKALPPYAVPLFIRKVPKLDMTGTYKMRKVDLREQGFKLDKPGEEVYYMDKSGKYLPMNNDVYNRIMNGELRF